jgi:RNA-splicing ligase RtcB
MCGIRPDDVKEPEIREKYIAALNANVARAKIYNNQMLIHRIMKTFPTFMDQFLGGMYRQPPEDLAELAGVLNSLGIKGARKENIISGVVQSFAQD